MVTCFSTAIPPQILTQVLAIASENYVSKPEDVLDPSQGFLVGNLSKSLLQNFLKDGGSLYVAEMGHQVVGYLLLTSIKEFLGYFSPEYQTESSKSQEEVSLNPNPRHPGILKDVRQDFFVYHIAVSRSAPRGGFGSQLLKQVIADHPARGLTADVLIEPFLNEASVSFFKKHGFSEVATAQYKKYKTFGDLKTVILRRLPAST